MFMPLLAALAIGATSAPQDEIVIIDDQPGIIIPLARFNLGRAEDLRRVRHRIAHAAISVCDRGYRGLSYFETAAAWRARSPMPTRSSAGSSRTTR